MKTDNISGLIPLHSTARSVTMASKRYVEPSNGHQKQANGRIVFVGYEDDSSGGDGYDSSGKKGRVAASGKIVDMYVWRSSSLCIEIFYIFSFFYLFLASIDIIHYPFISAFTKINKLEGIIVFKYIMVVVYPSYYCYFTAIKVYIIVFDPSCLERRASLIPLYDPGR